VPDQNGEKAEGVHQRMYTKKGKQRGLNGDAKRTVLDEVNKQGNVHATTTMSKLEDKGIDYGVNLKQIQVS